MTMASNTLFKLLAGTALFAITSATPVVADDSVSGTEPRFGIAPSDAVIMTRRDIRTVTTDLAEAQKKRANLYLSVTDPSPESDLERLALAEMKFLSFQPKPARDIYSPLMSSDDPAIRSHAWRRMLRMNFAAFNEFDLTEQQIGQYRTENPTTIVDYYGVYNAIRDLASYYADQSEKQRAVNIVLAEIDDVDRAARQASPRLIHDFKDLLISQIGEKALLEKATALRARTSMELERWNEKVAREETLQKVMCQGDEWQWYWSMNGVRPGESVGTARRRNLTFTLGRLDGVIHDLSGAG